MSKIFTLVTFLLITSSSYASQQEVHLFTLEMVETMLWHEGVVVEKPLQQRKSELPEELAVALDLLDS